MRPVIACSRIPLVAKDHTEALFLLIEIFGAALEKLGGYVAGVRSELKFE
jgi:hypothetical protein